MIMLKIGMAIAALILACLGAVAQLFGETFERQSESVVARKVAAGREAAGYQRFSAEAFPSGRRQVVWHPDPFGVSKFGFIPTEWTTRPQEIPLTWDVRILWASDGAGVAKASRADFSPRVKMARVD